MLAAAILPILGPAAGAAGWFTTASGVVVATPAIDELPCARMRAVLDAIDASGYRREAPLPEAEADMALLDYENSLSRAYYARCVAPEAVGVAPAEAFRMPGVAAQAE